MATKMFRPYLSEEELLAIISKFSEPENDLELGLYKKLLQFRMKIQVGLNAPQLTVKEKQSLEASLGFVPMTDSKTYAAKLNSLPAALLSDEDRFNSLGAKDAEEMTEEEKKEFAALSKKLYGF